MPWWGFEPTTLSSEGIGARLSMHDHCYLDNYPRCLFWEISKKNTSYLLLVNDPQNTVQFPALVKSWFHPGLGKMSKILILTVFMEVNMLWDVICSFGAKKARFEGEEKLIEKSGKLVEKSRKLVEKSRKLVEKSRASWKQRHNNNFLRAIYDIGKVCPWKKIL